MKWKKILTFCGKSINMFYSELFSMKQYPIEQLLIEQSLLEQFYNKQKEDNRKMYFRSLSKST